jgi:ABC-2 type transport system permease protein
MNDTPAIQNGLNKASSAEDARSPTNTRSAPVWEPQARGCTFAALPSLLWLCLRQQAAGKRLWVLAVLFSLPGVIAIIVRTMHSTDTPAENENALILSLLANALVPFAALWFASAMIQDEIEEQTLTYLLVRPLPRWVIYLSKLAATIAVTAVLSAVFSFMTYLAVYAALEPAQPEIPGRVLKIAALLALAVYAYASIFGALSLIMRRSLAVGLVYLVLFEGIVANVDFIARKLTVMYYFKVLVERWVLNSAVKDWSMPLADLPSAGNSVLVLVLIGVGFTLLGAILFSVREFRMKTPEPS